MAQTKRNSTTARSGTGKSTAGTKRTTTRSKKKPPELDKSWSILLFGVGLLLCAMAFVPGESAWKAVRTALFGVFGMPFYLLGLFLLYWAVLVALEQPIRARCLRALAFFIMLCGCLVAFSPVQLSGLDFKGVMAALFQNGQNLFGGGVLGGLVGGSLLLLCGPIAARIILIILLLASVMLITGVTPGDAWQFLADLFGDWQADHEERQEEREARRQAREEAREEARRRQLEEQAAEPRVPARVRRRSVDVDLGPDPINETAGEAVRPEPDEPVVGPGGTFGQFPAAAPAEPEEVFETTITLPGSEPEMPAPPDFSFLNPEEATQPAQPQPSAEMEPAAEAQAAPASGGELDHLVRKAMAEPSLTPAKVTGEPGDQMRMAPAAAGEPEAYHYPPLTLFQESPAGEDTGVEDELRKNAEVLVGTLESFGVKTRVLDICRGPSVTRYELQPLAGVKISRITSLADDIALNLATAGVRIEAPIPGKPAVGIEVPNRHSSPVFIRSIFETPVYTKSASPLTIALGKDIAGAPQVADLCKMPHLLIAGSTGSGKSVCVNSIIISFLYKSSPEDVKLILIDPKVVELAEYNGIPHLLMPVVTEPRKAAGALGSAVAEMERRYRLFAENNVRDIKSYNRMAAEAGDVDKLPYIAIIIDELADLMMVAGKEVEDYICRIAQKARAAGMHLIVATQRPSVDVITGLIKANIPSRIAFAVSSQVDSRTILDSGGAEKLLGMGDMLFMPVGASKPVRIQGTYVKDEEIASVLEFIKKDNSSQYNEEMIAEMEKRAVPEKGAESGGDEDGGHDPMLRQAAEVVIDAGLASTSLLQRRCKLGYARAARIMDEMEQLGIIGPYQGAKPREVLMTRQQLIEMTMNNPESTDA